MCVYSIYIYMHIYIYIEIHDYWQNHVKLKSLAANMDPIENT